MREFYYVDIPNANEKEINEELEKVSCTRTLGYYSPYARFLKGVKKVPGKRTKKGLFFEYEETYYYDSPVPMICELKKTDKGKEYLMEILTSTTYWRVDRNYQKPLENIVLCTAQAISSDDVVKFLKSLTPEEAALYKERVLELKNAMYLGYHAYLRRVSADKRHQQENEDFIDSFTRKHRK